MKLHLSLLDRAIDLPTKTATELRQLLNDLGLEVKDSVTENDDTIFTIETLANRGDHLSVVGVARELSARLLCAVRAPTLATTLPEKRASLPVQILTDLCLRYSLLEMQLAPEMTLRPDVAKVLGAPDPERHPIVHLLNYVWLEYGQPMHAFDREQLHGELRVVTLEKGEEIVALDGKKYSVPAGSIVICDMENGVQRIVAVAGVIGCANSMVTKATRRVAIESATFDPVTVRKTARAMGISTDASYTFERGADVENFLTALKRVIYLVSGTESSQVCHPQGITSLATKQSEKRVVEVKLQELREQLNLPRLAESEIYARLKYLGFQVSDVPATQGVSEKAAEREKRILVQVPTWRLWDIVNKEDIFEEVARAIGYGAVKELLPQLDPVRATENPLEALLIAVEPALHGSGFSEVITKSLYSQEEVNAIKECAPKLAAEHLVIDNALEKGYSHLKVTNCISLAKVAEANHRRGVQSVKIYEVARLFSATSDKDATYEFERDVLSLGLSGRYLVHEWRGVEGSEEQLLYLKGVVENIGKAIGVSLTCSESDNPLLHPGYQAKIKAGRKICGSIGMLHPQLQRAYDLKQPFYYAEIALEGLLGKERTRGAVALSDQPRVRRDITLKIPLRSFAGTISHNIFEYEIPNLCEVAIIDDFRRADEEFRRTTFRVTFQNNERTLASAEVDAAMTQVLGKLKEKGVELAG